MDNPFSSIDDFDDISANDSDLINNKVHLNIKCNKCGSNIEFDVFQNDLDKWNNNEGSVQDIFPYLTAGQREMFLSRICDSCWKKIFG